jgi:hypothetical protein
MFPVIALICLLLHTAVMQDCKTSGEQVSANCLLFLPFLSSSLPMKKYGKYSQFSFIP